MIEFNGIKETSFGLTVKNITKTVLPPIENRKIRKTASDGSHEFGSFFGDRLIQITFQDIYILYLIQVIILQIKK